jgi:hypothetical protein
VTGDRACQPVAVLGEDRTVQTQRLGLLRDPFLGRGLAEDATRDVAASQVQQEERERRDHEQEYDARKEPAHYEVEHGVVPSVQDFGLKFHRYG